MSTSGAAPPHAPSAKSASPRSPASDWSAAAVAAPSGADAVRPRPYDAHPRGNPPLERADLERGEEKLNRVLGW